MSSVGPIEAGNRSGPDRKGVCGLVECVVVTCVVLQRLWDRLVWEEDVVGWVVTWEEQSWKGSTRVVIRSGLVGQGMSGGEARMV